MEPFSQLFNELKKTPKGSLFNPWFDHDKKYDLGPDAKLIRKRQLHAYLSERLHSAKYLFIAEALGYQGGHFSGIAMTSERILLGHHQPVHGIPATAPFQSVKPQRTSKPQINPKGMTEPTATIMWKAIMNLGVDPYQVVLWNALPWHPYDPDREMLSNRTPGDGELQQGIPALREMIRLFPDCPIIAVGKKSEQVLGQLGIACTPFRHPANGGAPKFRRQFKQLIQTNQ